jgi:hypothetical protein
MTRSERFVGIRVDGNEAEKVLNELRLLLTNQNTTHALGRAGLNRVQSKFSWEQVACATQQTILARDMQ